MQRINIAGTAGFCFGVSRSIKIAEKEIQSGKCFSLGPIIHNENVVSELKDKGLIPCDADSDLITENSKVLIRSHGVSRATIERLKRLNVNIVDATCPNVSRIHKLARAADEEGRALVIIGQKGHPEVEGIFDRCKKAYVVSDSEELISLLENEAELKTKALTLLVQTTQRRNNFDACVRILKNMCTNLKVFDTICEATVNRQAEAVQIAKISDAVVVIGDRNSANSRHLAKICSELCPNTQFIQNASELNAELLIGANEIGVTAGASTPVCIVREVINKMSDELNVNEVVENELNEFPEDEKNEIQVTEQSEIQPAENRSDADECAEAELSDKPEAEQENAPAGEGTEETEAKEKSFYEMLEDSLKTIYNGKVVSGQVVSITEKDVTVDLGTKYSAFISAEELIGDGNAKIEDVVKIGDKIEAIVVRVNDVEGTAQLSKRRLDAVKAWNAIEYAYKNKGSVEGVIKEENKGGVVSSVNGIRVFIPASRTGLSRGSDLAELIGEKVQIKIIEISRGRGRVIGAVKSDRKARAEAVFNDIEVGKEYEGIVKNLTSYGAFVDIGGVDGMIHISELSWKRINHPSEVLNVGDKIHVHVIDFDKDKHRISLGFKKSEDNPWNIFNAQCKEGDVISVKVIRILPFGAFCEILPGVDGLIHISQIANRHIEKPEDVLRIGDVVDTLISEIDMDRQKVSLSIRALLTPNIDGYMAQEYAAAESEREDTAVEAPVDEALTEEAAEPAE